MKKTNSVMTVKAGDATILIYTRDGDTVKTNVYPDITTSNMIFETARENYGFIKGGKYYVALDTASGKKIHESEEEYNNEVAGRAEAWIKELFVVATESEIEAFKDWNFSATRTDNDENGVKSSTIEIIAEGKFDDNDSTRVTTAIAINGLVEKAQLISNDHLGTGTVTFEFTYDNASITLPDLSDYKVEKSPYDQ